MFVRAAVVLASGCYGRCQNTESLNTGIISQYCTLSEKLYNLFYVNGVLEKNLHHV